MDGATQSRKRIYARITGNIAYILIWRFIDKLLNFQCEVNDVKDQIEVLHAQHLKDQEEIQQLSNLYKVMLRTGRLFDRECAYFGILNFPNFSLLMAILKTVITVGSWGFWGVWRSKFFDREIKQKFDFFHCYCCFCDFEKVTLLRYVTV